MKAKIKVQTKFESKNPLIKKANERFFASIVSFVRMIRVKKVLDCGCGEGVVIKELRSKVKGLDLEGFDLDSDSIKVAQQMNPRIKFKQGSIYQIPYQQNDFPLVICTEVLEHLQSPEKALKELGCISSRYAIVSVPHEPFFRMMNILRLKYLNRLGNTPDHINNWLPFCFKEMLQQYFTIKEEIYPFPWMMFLLEKIND